MPHQPEIPPHTRREIEDAIRHHVTIKDSFSCILQTLAEMGDREQSEHRLANSYSLAFASAHIVDIIERLEILSHGQCQELFDAYLGCFDI